MRETLLSCREYLADKGYSAELLDLLDTSDLEKFKKSVEKLDSIASLPSKNRKPIPRIVAPTGTGGTPRDTTAVLLGEAFKPPKI